MRIKEARMRMRDIERGKMPWTIPLHRRLEIIRLGERSGIPATNRIGNIVPRIFKPVFPPNSGGRGGITRGRGINAAEIEKSGSKKFRIISRLYVYKRSSRIVEDLRWKFDRIENKSSNFYSNSKSINIDIYSCSTRLVNISFNISAQKTRCFYL